MKKFFNLSCAVLFGAMAVTGLSSCSDSDDNGGNTPNPTEQNAEIKSLTNVYLDDVVFPTYKNLADESENLYNLISSLKTKLKAGQSVSDAEIAAICKSYKDARDYWEKSEAFLYGAASDFEIDPHIDTWPLDVATLAQDLADDQKITKLDAADGIEYARTSLTAENLGFHGIEFIFFRDGQNRAVSFFNNNEKENYTYQGTAYFAGIDVTALEEVTFATAVAGDLRDKCYQLEVAWLGSKAAAAHQARVTECARTSDDFNTTVAKNSLSYGEDMRTATTTASTYNSWKKVVETILVSGCSNICAEVADQKMGQAYRAATDPNNAYHEGEDGDMEKDDPNYIESPYSYNSFTDFYGNIISIQNSLYNNTDERIGQWESNSVMAYLTKYNVAMATNLNNKLQAALTAIEVCRNSGTPFVKAPGATYVKTAMDAVGELDDALNEASAWILAN